MAKKPTAPRGLITASIWIGPVRSNAGGAFNYGRPSISKMRSTFASSRSSRSITSSGTLCSVAVLALLPASS